MMTIALKLKLNKEQDDLFNSYLFHLSSVYNWAIQKVKINLGVRTYKSISDNGRVVFGGLNENDLLKCLNGHSKRMGVFAQVIQSTVKRASQSWVRCFNKLSGRPKLKSNRNKLRSFTFPQIFKRHYPSNITGRINLPGIGLVKFHRQEIPEGVIKQIKIVKKASGWYAYLIIDSNRQLSGIKENAPPVGIDTGFKSLLTLSDGTIYENPRELNQSMEQMKKTQRGGNKKKVARKHEKIKNQRNDRNHKISLDVVRNYGEIYVTNDDLQKQTKKFGKSVTDAAIGELRTLISYKSSICGRKFSLVDNKNTTRSCNNCGALTGPTGLNQLGVRQWECSECGTKHDRDINAAINTLKVGLGLSLVPDSRVKPETRSDARVGHKNYNPY